MIEADILMRGQKPREPIMAHPPMTDSDITLQEWLQQVMTQNIKGIKLDFKRFGTSGDMLIFGAVDEMKTDNIEVAYLKL